MIERWMLRAGLLAAIAVAAFGSGPAAAVASAQSGAAALEPEVRERISGEAMRAYARADYAALDSMLGGVDCIGGPTRKT